jgi:hypothetical protein
MPNLSNLIGTNNTQFASVALTAVAGANSQTFPAAYFKVPFNAKFADPYNICTLNTSLSTITLPGGLYSIDVALQGFRSNANDIIVSTSITVNNTVVNKWPKYKLVTTQSGSTVELNTDSLTSAGIYLANSSSVALEQYWSSTGSLLGGDINDGVSGVFYRMDIWKLR